MSLREGAAYLGIGYDAMCEHVREGWITVVRFPGRAYVRVTKAALDAFVQSCSKGPIAGPTEQSHSPQLQGKKGHLKAVPKTDKDAPYAWTQRYAAK